MTLLNSRLLMSGADYFSNDQPINPYYADEAVSAQIAVNEHRAIHSAFESAGITVTKVNPPRTSQDGVYTANWALIRGNKAVLARLPNARKTEENWAEKVLTKQGISVERVPGDLKFSGQGDALPCGDYLFCGSTYRSDEQAQAFAAETLGYTRIQLRTVPQLDEDGNEVVNVASGWPDSFYYDIDLALSIIQGPSQQSLGTIAYCPAAFTPESQQILDNLTNFDKIIVSEIEAKQAFACNLVSTGQTVIMSASAPNLKAELEALGLTVITPEIRELAKGGGYIRCTSLSFNE